MGEGREKRAVPAAEIDFDRGTTVKDLLEVERRKRGRDEFWLAC
jgi:hypothetical protein